MEIFEEIDKKATAYQYIGSKDMHIISLFHWIDELEIFADGVRETDMDNELEEEIRGIVTRLTMEIGVRMKLLFP